MTASPADSADREPARPTDPAASGPALDSAGRRGAAVEADWGRRVAAMAVIAALGVAVIYIPQPIQTLVAAEFGVL